jgi:HlyD family secretion protein
MKIKRKHVWIGVAVVVVAGVAAGMVYRARGAKPLAVQTAKVDRNKIVQKVSATGKIQPKTQVEISADVSAKITQLPVTEGQWVEKGTFLVGLDRERYAASVESAEANVRSAEASAELVRCNLDRTEKEFKRSQQLKSSGLESASDYDTKESAHLVETARYKAAQDQVAQARAALKQAQADLSKTSIYSPMAGTVCALNKEQGEIALGSQFQKDVIMIIADLSAMEAEVNVDENDIASIALGQESEISVDAIPGTQLRGRVSEISNSANVAAAGTMEQKTEFEIKIAISDPPAALRPGMTASAEVITKTNEDALCVPLQSVAVRTFDQLTMKGEKREDVEKRFQADEDGFVEIVFCVEKGKAVATQVKTGIQSDEFIEILDGLAEGKEVVSGSYRAISRDLENGGMVTIDNERKTSGREEASGQRAF